MTWSNLHAQTARNPSQLIQRNDLAVFTRKSSPNPDTVNTAKYLADFRTRRNTTQKPSQLKQQKYLAHFSKEERAKRDTVNIANWTWPICTQQQ
jgi:hypothetical protein